MKKKNIIIALAIIAVSSIPLMAYELDTYNIDRELVKEVKAIAEQEIDIQQDEGSPYHNFILAYIEFDKLIKDTSLSNKKKSTVCKNVFDIINDMAKAILAMPEEDQTAFTDSVTQALRERPFKYKNEVATTWKELFDFAIQNKSVHYDANTPVVKLLGISVPTTNEKSTSSWWQGFIETMQHEK